MFSYTRAVEEHHSIQALFTCFGFEHFGCVSSDSHVLHSDILEDLAVVNIPDRLVIPDLRGQEDGSQHDALPVGWANIDLRVSQEPLQINLTQRKPRFEFQSKTKSLRNNMNHIICFFLHMPPL